MVRIRIGKTSLAFKLAYDNANTGNYSLYICNQKKIEEKLPHTVIATTDASNTTSNISIAQQQYSPELMSRIIMKYVKSTTDLKRLFAGR